MVISILAVSRSFSGLCKVLPLLQCRMKRILQQDYKSNMIKAAARMVGIDEALVDSVLKKTPPLCEEEMDWTKDRDDDNDEGESEEEEDEDHDDH